MYPELLKRETLSTLSMVERLEISSSWLDVGLTVCLFSTALSDFAVDLDFFTSDGMLVLAFAFSYLVNFTKYHSHYRKFGLNPFTVF